MKKPGIIELHEKLNNKEITSEELIREAINNAHELQKKCNAFVTIMDDANSDFYKNTYLSGIPYGIKDNYSTKDILSTGSSNTLKDYVPFFDATAVINLKNNGAVGVAKTALDEFGMGGTGLTAHTGIIKNPWDNTRICGGSSAGSACSVAAGVFPYALGSDTGSQKALMLPPGLAMIGLSNDAVAKIESKPRGYYFNLATEIKKQRTNTTAWTAATTLIIGLGAILEKLKADGFENLYKNTAKRANATREALKAIGFDIYPKTPADAMTTVYTEQSSAIRKILKNKYNVNIAGGQDHLAGKIFRINHMGLVEDYESSWAVNAVELTLDDLGIRTFDGTANKVFASNMFKGN
jgi:hypothetical protein